MAHMANERELCLAGRASERGPVLCERDVVLGMEYEVDDETLYRLSRYRLFHPLAIRL